MHASARSSRAHRPRATRLLAATAATLLALTTLGGCCKQTRPDAHAALKPSGPLARLAAQVSAKSSLVVVVPNVREAVRRGHTLTTFDPRLHRALQGILGRAGVSMADVKTLTRTGLDVDGGAILAVTNRGAALLIRAKDLNTFQRFMEQAFNGKASVQRPGTYPVWRVQRGPRWRVLGDTIMFVDGHSSIIDSMCHQCLHMPGTSLAQDQRFWRFQREVMDAKTVAGVYLPARGDVYGDIAHDMTRGMGYMFRRQFDAGRVIRALTALKGGGFGLKMTDASLQIDAWAGLSAEDTREARALLRALDPKPFTPARHVPADVLGFARVQANPQRVFTHIMNMLQPRGQRDIEQGLRRAKERANLDLNLRRDLADRLAGNMLLTVHQRAGRRMDFRGLDAGPTSLALTLTLRDQAARDHLTGLLRKVAEVDRIAVQQRDVKAGGATVKVLELAARDFPRVLLYKNMMMLTGRGLDEVKAAKMLTGGLGVDALAKVKQLKLANTALKPGHAGAAYVRLDTIKQGAPTIPAALRMMIPDEAALTLDVTATGLRARLVATPGLSGKAAAAAIKLQQVRAQRQDMQREATLQLRQLADGAKTYFTSEQKYDRTTEKAREPWHAGVAWPATKGAKTPNNAYGMPIEWKYYTFPGGPSFTMRSHADVPKGGAGQLTKPTASQPAWRVAAGAKLSVSTFEPGRRSRWRYTYQTGPGTGERAVVTITAEADLDPATKARWTLTRKVYIDRLSQEVIVQPIVTTNEFE